ncbi:hypothetical protein ES332_D12G108500v1 [Gossypium tomentosum]|uniref:J domain-containing protein n=1 Tax=Gossypium tomentosum TaxID=34277 RepID=A0A5D2I743_GOSTO|nr:hypothetical protein ES332_D12G108500v1 [Gossypium tomentosum]
MQFSRWRNLFLLKSSLVPAFLPAKQTATVATTHAVSFHSTRFTCEKWKSKWNFDERSTRQPTKFTFFICFSKIELLWHFKYCMQSYVRYAMRQKCGSVVYFIFTVILVKSSDLSFYMVLFVYSDLPRIFYIILKTIDQHSARCFGVSIARDDDPIWKFDRTEGWDSDGSVKKWQSRFSGQHTRKSNHKKRRFRKIFSDDFDHPETMFQTVFGKKCYTWSFSGNFTFRSSESGFEWREKSDWTNQRTEEWEPSSESESVDESYAVGSCSDRAILGLPPTGHLKLEDVKKAFRLSALKWHPDKNQSPSQAMAEEKFKTCVAAYKSLCNALA